MAERCPALRDGAVLQKAAPVLEFDEKVAARRSSRDDEAASGARGRAGRASPAARSVRAARIFTVTPASAGAGNAPIPVVNRIVRRTLVDAVELRGLSWTSRALRRVLVATVVAGALGVFVGVALRVAEGPAKASLASPK